MRIRVTEVFSLLWCIFGESMSVKKRKKYKELRRNFGRKRKEGMAICNSSRDDERFAFDHWYNKMLNASHQVLREPNS